MTIIALSVIAGYIFNITDFISKADSENQKNEANTVNEVQTVNEVHTSNKEYEVNGEYTKNDVNENPANIAVKKIPDDYVKVAETQELELFFSSQSLGIILKDKRNGYLWKSNISEDDYSLTGVSDLWKNNMNSLFYLNYTTDFKRVSSTNSRSHQDDVKAERIRDGIKLTYNMKKLSIKLSIEISLRENSLIVNVPGNEIDEYGNNFMTSIEILPFFGSATRSDEGYIFYPDGCGALYNFKSSPGSSPTKYTLPVYGADSLDLNMIEENNKLGVKQALMPVFGVKKGENAFIAIISKGEFDAAINLYPYGYAVNFHRISTEFFYRRNHKDERPYATTTTFIESNMIREDHEIIYVMLEDNEADYSGMANAYRNYLVREKKINNLTDDKSGMPLWLDLFMGIRQEQILFDKFIKATTFEQAKIILEELKNIGVDNIDANLIGWAKGGYGVFPEQFPPDNALGGLRGLKELVEYTSENNINLFLEINPVDASKNGTGFSKRKDITYHRNGLAVINTINGGYILNPPRTLERFKLWTLPKFDEISLAGLTFDKLGSFIYFDYNENKPSMRSKTASCWNEIVNLANQKFNFSAVRGGNAYILGEADILLDIPVNDSGYFITQETIPFFQMVVHGYIPYTSEPGNLFYDHSYQKLKWAEYGCIPYFKLTYQEPVILRKTSYNHLFTSYYKHWIDTAAEIYKEFNICFDDIWNKTIIKHEMIDKGVYKVTYEDGSKVYVNYNQDSVYVENHQIEGMDYIVVNKEGKVIEKI